MVNVKVKIMVGTPAYNGQMQADYVRSLLDMAASGLPFALYTITSDSLVARARNTILAQFHQRRDFTHLLFLDADVAIRGRDVLKLVGHDKDVIGAPVPLKTNVSQKPLFNLGEVLSRTGTLASVTRIGTAALLLSRRAVDKMVESAIESGRTYTPDTVTRGDVASGLHYDVFRQGVVDGQYVSEDYRLCDDLRLLGFEIFVDLAVRTRHFGMYEFDG